MKRKLILSAVLLMAGTALHAQNPKWFKKAQKAQLTIVTFNAEGDILQSGCGFFIGEDGTALSGYSLFKQAASAKAVSTDGKEYEVDAILGANSLYDVVKFRVKTDKKTAALTPAGRIGVSKEHVYVLPYPTKEKAVCLNDTLKEIQKFNEDYGYYTLSQALDAAYVNCPVMSEEGELMGMIQPNAPGNKGASFAIATEYGRNLAVRGLSATDRDLTAIGIRKALPADEDEARTFLFMSKARTDSATYSRYLDEYAELFPRSAEAYTQRADFNMAYGNYAAAEADMEKALSVVSGKDEVYYSFGEMIYSLNLLPQYQVYKDWTLEKALSLSEQATALKDQPIYIQQQAQILYAMKEYEKAYEKFMALAGTNLRSGRMFLFAAQSKRMAGAEPAVILALQDSAVACYRKPYPAEASTALLERANTLLLLERYREAVRDMNEYEQLTGSDNLTGFFYYRREQAGVQCRMFQQAVDDIDRAIRKEPQEPLYHAERASLHYRIGELEEAIRSARRSVELKPDFADGHRVLGVCLLHHNQREEGLAELKKAAELGDESAKEILTREEGQK